MVVVIESGGCRCSCWLCKLAATLSQSCCAMAEVPPRAVFFLSNFVSRPAGSVVTKTPELEVQLDPDILKRSLVMAFTLTDTQMVTVEAQFLDAKGNPAQVDGQPTWLVDNSEFLALEPAADGFSCLIKAVGPLGVANVTVKADADMGEGVRHVFDTMQVEVIGGEAKSVVLIPGVPVEQPSEMRQQKPTQPR